MDPSTGRRLSLGRKQNFGSCGLSPPALMSAKGSVRALHGKKLLALGAMMPTPPVGVSKLALTGRNHALPP
eukprot:6954108-Alexandrium_andersonii.AAC.1